MKATELKWPKTVAGTLQVAPWGQTALHLLRESRRFRERLSHPPVGRSGSCGSARGDTAGAGGGGRSRGRTHTFTLALMVFHTFTSWLPMVPSSRGNALSKGMVFRGAVGGWGGPLLADGPDINPSGGTYL